METERGGERETVRAQEDREHDREKKHKGEDGRGRVAEREQQRGATKPTARCSRCVID